VSISVLSAAETADKVVKTGAQLFDNWPKITSQEFTENHQFYPKEGKQKGTSTWRCKECHGWDYKGKDGRYSKGSHYTGIKGLYKSKGKTSYFLRRALTQKKGHNFTDKLSDEQISALISFIQNGIIDTDKYIVDSGKKVKGDVANGKKLYHKNCSSCHWGDGKLIDLNSKKEGKQGLGVVSNDNPQETLHKIRWGHPGSEMPSAVVDGHLSEQETVDILSFIRTLK